MPKTSPPIETRIIAAALQLAGRQDWSELTLDQIAKAAKWPLAQVKKRFHDRDDILPAIVLWVDRKMMVAIGKQDPSAAAHDRLFEIMMARFDILQSHRRAILGIMDAVRRNPALLRGLVPAQTETMKSMLHCAGLKQNGAYEILAVAGLLVVYAGALCAWRADTSSDMSKTMAKLDRYLRHAGMVAEILFRSRA